VNQGKWGMGKGKDASGQRRWEREKMDKGKWGMGKGIIYEGK